MPITVLCNQKKAHLLPHITEDTQLSQVSLGELRAEAQKVFDYTHVPVRMIYAGMVMKNDTASLASYGINFRSKVIMIPTQHSEAQSNPIESSEICSEFEKQACKQIEGIVNKTVSESSKTVTGFPSQILQFHEKYPKPSTIPEYVSNHRELEKTYFSAHETLIKGLLQLDAVVASDPEQPDVSSVIIRDQRKGAVRKLETLLDQLDHSWAQFKASYPRP